MGIDLLKEYEKRKWIVHPLSSPKDTGNSPGKKPLLKEWQKLAKTPGNIKSYSDKRCNIGLVCGKASNVTVIDFDSLLFFDDIKNKVDAIPLMSRRTEGRGHMYFEYNPDLPAQKHHDLGIEILNDGSNAVLPPSIHVSGEVYRWNDPDTPIIQMPKKLEENLKKLFKTESELKQVLGKCRQCFKDVIKKKPDVHGAEGRQFMVAISAELMAVGAKEEHLKLFSKLMYDRHYDENITLRELSYIDPGKTWRCSTLKDKLPGYVMNYCKDCRAQESNGVQTKIPENVIEYFRTVAVKDINAIILVYQQ